MEKPAVQSPGPKQQLVEYMLHCSMYTCIIRASRLTTHGMRDDDDDMYQLIRGSPARWRPAVGRHSPCSSAAPRSSRRTRRPGGIQITTITTIAIVTTSTKSSNSHDSENSAYFKGGLARTSVSSPIAEGSSELVFRTLS